MKIKKDYKMSKLLCELRKYNIDDEPIKHKNITIYTLVNTVCIEDKEGKEQPIFQFQRWEDFVKNKHIQIITDIVDEIVKEMREVHKQEQKDRTAGMLSWFELAMEELIEDEE